MERASLAAACAADSLRKELFELERDRACLPGKDNPVDDEFLLNIEPIRVMARSEVREGDGEEGRDVDGVAEGGVPEVPGADGGVATEAIVRKIRTWWV